MRILALMVRSRTVRPVTQWKTMTFHKHKTHAQKTNYEAEKGGRLGAGITVIDRSAAYFLNINIIKIFLFESKN